MTDTEIAHPKFGSALPKQQHVFGDPVSVPKNFELDRHPQTERTCKLCGAVKVTVHPPEGGGYRLWRRNASAGQTDCEPTCELQFEDFTAKKP